MADERPEFDSDEQKEAHLAALATEKEYLKQTGRDPKEVEAEISRIKKQRRPTGEHARTPEGDGE